LQGLVGNRHQVAGADEEVKLAGAEPARRRVEDREVEDDEEVVVVDVDLRPLVAREDVLEVERVEVEVLFQPAALERTRTSRSARRSGSAAQAWSPRGSDRRAAQPAVAVVSEGSASFGLIVSSAGTVIVTCRLNRHCAWRARSLSAPAALL
jgi:hypothetical protein